jgi:hypothetical protein
MWEGLMDYKTFKWQDVLQQIQKNLDNDNTILEAFDMVWGSHHAIYLCDG